MFDNNNPYTLRTITDGSVTQYFVSFVDDEGDCQEAEVSKTVYLEFHRFIRVERNLRRWDERHMERFALSDAEIHNRAQALTFNAEDIVSSNMLKEKLQHAVQRLPKKQRRRFVLYYDFALNYSQIAEVEGCSRVAVKYTIDNAKLQIAKELKDFFV